MNSLVHKIILFIHKVCHLHISYLNLNSKTLPPVFLANLFVEQFAQILFNYYCNDRMNFDDGTCCKHAAPLTPRLTPPLTKSLTPRLTPTLTPSLTPPLTLLQRIIASLAVIR